MSFLRWVKFEFKFNCCYLDVPQLDRFVDVGFDIPVERRKKYKSGDDMDKDPNGGDINTWAKNIANKEAKRMANKSCEELRFPENSGCYIDVSVVDSGEEREIKVIKLPTREVEIVELIKDRIREAETLDEKEALAREIVNIYKRYGVPEPKISDLIKG